MLEGAQIGFNISLDRVLSMCLVLEEKKLLLEFATIDITSIFTLSEELIRLNVELVSKKGILTYM